MRAPELRPPLIVAALGVAAAAALATPSLPVPLRAIAAVSLAFGLPGAALTLGLLPRVLLRRSERIALALGGSLASAIGLAFVLHALPSGLSAGAWASILGATTVVGSVLGWLRTARPLPAGATATASAATAGSAATPAAALGPWVVGPPAAPTRALVSLSSIAMLAAAGVLVALAFMVARSGVALGPTASFTELWMLPMDGGTAVRVGVANHEGVAETYRLELTLDGRPLREPATVTVAAGGSTDAIVELPGGVEATRTVEARLWRSGQAASEEPDRLVRVTVTSDPGSAP
jgi:uncharacterized membrane protein